MDTVLLPRLGIEKTAVSAASIGIVICLILSLNLSNSANGVTQGSLTGVTPTLNYLSKDQQERELIFNQDIEIKYPAAKITDVEKGVKHVRMIRYYNGRPVRINVVEISQGINNNISISPAIASHTLASKSKISTIAQKNGAIVSINGGYFKPQTGVPLGTLMIDGKLYTGPIFDRVSMGFFDNGFDMARVKLDASVETNIGGLKIDNVNQPRMLSVHTIVYTSDWGEYSPPTPKYGRQLVIQNGKLIRASYGRCKIPENGFVVVGPEKQINKIISARKFKLKININPEWKGVNHIISGGPYLVKDNEIFVDMTAQKLGSIGGRNPRTAIGYTKDNNIILLTADGREGSSIRLTLMELANLMKEFGCVNAMNLDGGGSTVMYVDGEVVNKPVVYGGIPLSHTLNVSVNT